MKVFITGVAGYIGSVLAHKMLSDGHKVIGLDNLLHGGRSIIGLLNNPNFIFIQGDLSDLDLYKDYIDKETNVVNLAAIVGEPASRKMPEETKRTNLDATKNLVDYCAKVQVRKFVFISTCSNYGKVENGKLANEESKLNPLSLYAKTKVDIEEYLKNKVKTSLNWTILRFSTVYGLSPRPRFDLTVNDFTFHALKDKKLTIFLPKSNRPYVHVFDAARAISIAIEEIEKSANQIFNVGDTRENYRKIDIVEEIKKVLGDFKVEFVEKGNDPRDYRVSFEKIKNILNYNVSRRVPDGVREIFTALDTGLIRDPENKEYYNV